ncbi:hypothetical protein DL546_007453 [Coniochaeta pulveracea]|uniref:Uncharacterized protein n=1 Tax=Coniochaeta pulveracea TaxID=177199 RepID=A0A420YK76_9PEZI|nr:hypothetical protein DL546_007453 [Coniochaeta pulveracea]
MVCTRWNWKEEKAHRATYESHDDYETYKNRGQTNILGSVFVGESISGRRIFASVRFYYIHQSHMRRLERERNMLASGVIQKYPYRACVTVAVTFGHDALVGSLGHPMHQRLE